MGMDLLTYRTKKGLSVDKAARQLGVSAVSYRFWENGKKIPSREKMVQIYIWSDGLVEPNSFYFDYTSTLQTTEAVT